MGETPQLQGDNAAGKTLKERARPVEVASPVAKIRVEGLSMLGQPLVPGFRIASQLADFRSVGPAIRPTRHLSPLAIRFELPFEELPLVDRLRNENIRKQGSAGNPVEGDGRSLPDLLGVQNGRQRADRKQITKQPKRKDVDREPRPDSTWRRRAAA